MKKLLLLVLTSLSLIASNLPQSTETTIQTVKNNGVVQLTKDIQKGMSGIIIHDYGNGLSAITHALISQGEHQATIKPYNILKHEKLPSIKTIAKKGDKVIFGNLYNNALLIAPNEQSYSKITKSIKKTWIHPDTYALYLTNNDEIQLSLENLKAFAIKNQVGLVFIVTKESLLVLDPLSKAYLTKQPLSINTTKAQSPFYARFEQINTNIFSTEDLRTFPEYYKGIGRLK